MSILVCLFLATLIVQSDCEFRWTKAGQYLDVKSKRIFFSILKTDIFREKTELEIKNRQANAVTENQRQKANAQTADQLRKDLNKQKAEEVKELGKKETRKKLNSIAYGLLLRYDK